MQFSDRSLIGKTNDDIINFVLVVFLDINLHPSLSRYHICCVLLALSLFLLLPYFLEFTYHLIISTKEAPSQFQYHIYSFLIHHFRPDISTPNYSHFFLNAPFSPPVYPFQSKSNAFWLFRVYRACFASSTVWPCKSISACTEY